MSLIVINTYFLPSQVPHAPLQLSKTNPGVDGQGLYPFLSITSVHAALHTFSKSTHATLPGNEQVEGILFSHAKMYHNSA